MQQKPYQIKTTIFTDSTTEHKNQRKTSKSRKFSPKAMEDSRHLRIIKLMIAALPTIVFGVFTVVFTLQQDSAARATREQDQRQVDETNRRVLFKEYIDDMKELLLDPKYRQNLNESVLQIRIQTLTVLRLLDASRKRDVLRFLYESRLIRHDQPVYVNLEGADLTGVEFVRSSVAKCEFPFLYLPGVHADNIVFQGCILIKANFENAAMAGAKLYGCTLAESNFAHTNLTQAEFHDSHLFGSNFAGAILIQSSILRGVFQNIDLTNIDFYAARIDDRLLYPLNYNGVVGNFILNSRLPNGSFSYINSSDLLLRGRADGQCHLNMTSFWTLLGTEEPIKVFNWSETTSVNIQNSQTNCFFAIDPNSMTYQLFDVRNYSTLIDLEQAMVNLSLAVVSKNFNKEDRMVVFLHFLQGEGSFDYMSSLRQSFSNLSSVNRYIHARQIPAKTRLLSFIITCDIVNRTDQLCLFNDVSLNIYKADS